jgi:V8-like Glu-specific endopeptidase
LVLGACTAAADPPLVAAIAQPVIYGDDDRVELDALAGVSWIAGAAARAVALVSVPSAALAVPADIEDAGTEGASDEDTGVPEQPWSARTAGARFELCAEERFAEQPSVAECSGVLVSNDIVLVAGHCFAADDPCERYRYALGYTEASGDAGISDASLMRCRELIIREVGRLADGSSVDYALVRLERAVAAADASALTRDPSVAAGATVTSIGFPAGLPLKIDPNGEVLTVDRTGFELLTDAYHGSSGSAVYDRAGGLVGILTHGQTDFAWDAERRCRVSRVIAENDAGTAERAMHAWVALSRACFGKPELTLCAGMADAGMLERPVAIEPVATREQLDDSAGSAAEQRSHDTADAVSGSVVDEPLQDSPSGREVARPRADAGRAIADEHAARRGGCSAAPGTQSTAAPVLLLFCALLRVLGTLKSKQGAIVRWHEDR